jgi:hypothetical protein
MMDIHPSVLTEDQTRQGIYHAIERSLITTHIGNGPTQIFMLGDDTAGRLLEISAVVRHEDILIIHVAEARHDYLALIEEAPVATPTAAGDPTGMSYGKSADNLELTEDLIGELFATADDGYDVDRLSVRTRPGRPAPLTVGGAVRLGLDESLKDAVSKAAAHAGITEASFAEGALRDYLSA